MSTASSVYDLVSSADTTGIEDFSTLFAYEGFNPELVHNHFAKIMDAKGLSETEFLNDIRALIVLGAMKGNYTLKNSKKISSAGKTKADALYSKYNLKQGSLADDKKAIILPRVLSAFPDLTTKVIMKVAPRDFGTQTGFLPKFMKNPVFPALVPKTLPSNITATLLWLYTVYSADQSLVISTETNFGAAFANQKKFVDIAHNSAYPPEPVRISMFKAQMEEIVQAVSSSKALNVGAVPANRATAQEARSAITVL